MSRLLRATALLVLVAACGSGNYSAPRNLDNACSIVSQRPNYLKAMQRTERKYGVPVAVQMATIYQESKFIGNARTPHQFALGIIPMGRQSSAYGYSQALDGTWEEYQQVDPKPPRQTRRYRGCDRFHGLVHGAIEPRSWDSADRCAEPVSGLSRGPDRLCAWQPQGQKHG